MEASSSVSKRLKLSNKQSLLSEYFDTQIPSFALEEPLYVEFHSRTELYTYVDTYRGLHNLLTFVREEAQYGKNVWIAASLDREFFKR